MVADMLSKLTAIPLDGGEQSALSVAPIPGFRPDIKEMLRSVDGIQIYTNRK